MGKAPALLIVSLALALGGCGYKPLYGSSVDSAGVSTAMASVSIPEASDRLGQMIRNDLISTMRSGSGEDRYTLIIKPVLRKTEVIDKPQPSTTRQAINLSVSFELLDRASGASLHKGKTFSQAAFDLVRQPFADLQAETNATERAAHEVSADIRTRIAAYFSSHPAKS